VTDHAALTCMKDFALLDLQDYRDLAKNVNHGQAMAWIGVSNMKKLAAASHWVKRHIQRGLRSEGTARLPQRTIHREVCAEFGLVFR
jgi:hypothetical protein